MSENSYSSLTKFIDVAVYAIKKAITTLYTSVPPEHRVWVSLFLILAAFVFLAFFVQPFLRKIWNFFREYVKQRHAHAKYRFEFPGAYCWGNSALRAPLIIIGTDIFCFAQLSAQGKAYRYIKSASVVIPTIWSALGMIIFVATSKDTISDIDYYIAAIPIILVAATIFILDLSIIAAQGSKPIKLFRIVAAMITGYIFSSIPLNHYFKSSIDSHLEKNDSQSIAVASNFDTKIKALENEDWYKNLQLVQNQITLLQSQLSDERMGKGITGKVNSATGTNPKYNEILTELNAAKERLETFRQASSEKLVHYDELLKMRTMSLTNIRENNRFDHIKRHTELWNFAFSDIGKALYFIALLAIFWTIDTLSVLVSFIDESEYRELCSKRHAELTSHFGDADIKMRFMPTISVGAVV